MLKLAFCGNDCKSCPRYLATLSGDEEKLKEAALLWQKVGWREEVVPPEQMMCRGCTTATWCRYGIQQCALAKDVQNCGQCDDYACEKILKAFEKAEIYAEEAKKKLSKEDYKIFRKAFFLKKKNLDGARREHLSRKKE